MNGADRIFRIARQGQVVVVTPLRDLSEFEFQAIQGELREVAADPAARAVVVDFGRTDYLGSTALGMLGWLGQELKRRGGRLAFCNLSTHERDVFRVVGLAEFWPSFASLREAVAAVRPDGAGAAIAP